MIKIVNCEQLERVACACVCVLALFELKNKQAVTLEPFFYIKKNIY
jgi:hypothetical protein